MPKYWRISPFSEANTNVRETGIHTRLRSIHFVVCSHGTLNPARRIFAHSSQKYFVGRALLLTQNSCE
jgi:hypothetical protein